MCSSACHLVEFGARQKFNRNAELAAVFDHPLQADVMPLLRHSNPLESPSPGFERLADGIDAINVVHEYSVYRKLRRQTALALSLARPGRARLYRIGEHRTWVAQRFQRCDK